MKTCPRCGFTGDLSHCPNDGEVLCSPEELSGRAPAEPTQAPLPVSREHPVVATAPTMADLSLPGGDPFAGAPPPATPPPAPPRPPPRPPKRPASQPAAATGGSSPSSGDSHSGEHAELMRDENFGKWAEPEVKKKAGDPMLGRVISGRYEVISLLGQGGMGAVYKARQPAMKQNIALKILLKEFADNETVVKRFHQEALAASRLSHPNTIKVFDFGQTEDGILYMAMELLKGESLAHAVSRGGPMPPKRVIHIMRQCCKSLAEAHRSGIIHRDLKPDNIFLTDIQGERDFAKVLDFGVAKLKEYEGKEGTLTQAGMIFGTPKYMSPEQARSGALDARSDIYALGVIMYELLMGKPPFSGDNPLSILISHVNEQPRRFIQFNPKIQVPTALEAVVFKALSKDREQRHATVEQLQTELDAIDEMLSGATYDSVADRLPALLPGAEGDPSLVGPAIVPAGETGTAPAKPLEKGGTIRLGEDGQPVLGDQSPTAAMLMGDLSLTGEISAPPPPRRTGLFVVLGLAAAAAGATGVVLTRNASTASNSPPEPASLAANITPTAPPTPATSAPAPTSQTGGPGGTQKGDEGKSCLIITDPDGAKIFATSAPDVLVGVATKPGFSLRLTAKTEYVVRQTGYKDGTVIVDPATDPCVAQAPRLKALPRSISQATANGANGTNGASNPTTPVTIGIGGGTNTAAPPPPNQPPTKGHDIDLQ